MSRRVKDDSKILDEINVTPLLDLAWCLLVVFVISVTAAVQGIKISLPKASAAASQVKASTKAITVMRDGKIFLDSFPVTMEQLETRLRQYKAVDPNFPVVVRGDEDAYYKSVIEVLDLLGRLDITQLGLVTKRLVK
jgi:biopolymer transport protein ExbD